MIVIVCKHELTKKFGKDRKGNPRVRCCECGKTWIVAAPSLIGNMRVDMDRAEMILKCLCEGTSVRATARLTNTDPHTVIDLMIFVGERCARFMTNEIKKVSVEDIQVDEVWQYIGCKQRVATLKKYGPEMGDSYLFTAIDRTTKLLVAFHLGKRDGYNTDLFCRKLSTATAGRFHLSSDGFGPYRDTIPRVLGSRVDFGMLIKTFGKSSAEDQRQYSPAKIIGTKKEAIHNWPKMDKICTSHVERQNLNFRTFVRRMTRLSNGFSKVWRNHEAMIALYICHYNYVRVHGTIKTTPAVASGLTTKKWTVREMLERTATH